MCWSVASLLSDAHVFDSKFPVAILPHQSMQTESVKRDVHRLIAKIIGWSLRISASGIAPTVGAFGETLTGERAMMSGKPLASGWRGTYFCCRFDEKARKEVNEFQRSYLHSMVCMNCLAQQPHKHWQPELCYKNFHSSAAHRLCPIGFLIPIVCMCFLLFGNRSQLFTVIALKTRQHPSQPQSCCLLRLCRLFGISRTFVTVAAGGRVASQDCLSWSHAYGFFGNVSRFVCFINGVLDSGGFLWRRVAVRKTPAIFSRSQKRLQKWTDLEFQNSYVRFWFFDHPQTSLEHVVESCGFPEWVQW